MRLGYFGGSFDPPHHGHLTIALAAAAHFSLDRVLLAPTGRQPFKHSGATASFADRLAMTNLLCRADPALLQASALDGPHPDGSPNYTIDALAALHAATPEADLFAILGADSLAEFPRWHRFPELLELAEWIVVSRPGFPAPASLPEPLAQAERSGRLHQLAGIEIPVASRDLRTHLHSASSPSTSPEIETIPTAVRAYIQEHALYRAAPAHAAP